MTHFSVKPYLSFLLAVFIMSSLLWFTGCMGGGGGSTSSSETDVQGITTSLNGFLTSMSSNKSNSYLAPKLKSISTSEHNKGYISVWDFGADINNADDNASYSFSIPSDGIIQPSSDYAKAYAIANIRGKDFRIDFILVKIDGQWFIDNLEYTSTDLGYVSSNNILPLQRYNSWQMVQIPANASGSLVTPHLVTATITEDATVKDGHSVYWLYHVPSPTTYAFNLDNYSSTLSTLRKTDSWPILAATYELTQNIPYVDTDELPPIYRNIKHILTEPDNIAKMGFSNNLGLYFFGKDTLSGGRAVKILNSLSAVGHIATDAISVRWSDGSDYSVYMAARLARKVTIQTFAGNYTAWQIDIYNHFTSAIPSGQSQNGYYSMLLAENHGIVAEVNWDVNQKATDILLMYSASVGGKTIPAVDSGIDSNLQQFSFYQPSPLTVAVQGRAYSKPMLSGGNPPYSMSLQSGYLPAGLTINKEGTISGTPSATGRYSFSLIATDSYNRIASKAYEMSVNIPLLMSSSSPLATGTVGAEYTQTLVFGGLPPYTLSTLGGILPSGLTLSNDKLSGVPTSQGLFNFDISAQDSEGIVATASYVVNIERPLSFTKIGLLPNGVVSVSYTQNIVTGGTPPYDLQLSSGILPSGISTYTSGLSGVPTTVGNYAFGLRVTDAVGKIATSSFTINVTSTTSDLAFIYPGVMPLGEKLNYYTWSIATGGVSPYTVTISSGSVPVANPQNNLLYGSPSSAGKFNFDFTVVDSVGTSITQPFVWTVVETLYFEQAETMSSITVNQPYTNTLASGGATPYQFTLEPNSTLPTGLTLDAASGLTGVPTVAGTYQFVISVKDDLHVRKERSFTLTVNPEAPKVPTIDWQKYISETFGNSDSEAAKSVKQTPDNGFIVGGIIDYGNNNTKVRLVKYSSLGVEEWSKDYGGSKFDYISEVITTSDGGYAFVGQTSSEDFDLANFPLKGGYDAWIVKVNPSGTIDWQKTYGGGKDENFSSVIQKQNGDFIIAGDTFSSDGDIDGFHLSLYSDAWVMEVSNNDPGTIMKSVIIGGNQTDVLNQIIKTSDNNLLVVGYTNSSDADLVNTNALGGNDCWVMKLNMLDLSIDWQKRYGDSGADELNDVEETSDGFCLVGSTRSSAITGFAGSVDVYAAKIDLSGNLTWQKALGGTLSENGYAINAMPDGTFNIAGAVGSSNGGIISGFHGNWDTWILQLSVTGDLNWQLCLGGAASEQAYDMIKTSDNKNMLVGYTNSTDGDLAARTLTNTDWWLIKMK